MEVTTMDNPLLVVMVGVGMVVVVIAGAVHFVQNMRSKQKRTSARRNLAS